MALTIENYANSKFHEVEPKLKNECILIRNLGNNFGIMHFVPNQQHLENLAICMDRSRAIEVAGFFAETINSEEG